MVRFAKTILFAVLISASRAEALHEEIPRLPPDKPGLPEEVTAPIQMADYRVKLSPTGVFGMTMYVGDVRVLASFQIMNQAGFQAGNVGALESIKAVVSEDRHDIVITGVYRAKSQPVDGLDLYMRLVSHLVLTDDTLSCHVEAEFLKPLNCDWMRPNPPSGGPFMVQWSTGMLPLSKETPFRYEAGADEKKIISGTLADLYTDEFWKNKAITEVSYFELGDVAGKKVRYELDPKNALGSYDVRYKNGLRGLWYASEARKYDAGEKFSAGFRVKVLPSGE